MLYSLLALFAKLTLLPSSQHWVLLKINKGIFKCNLSSELPWRLSVTRTIRQLAAFNQPWTNLNWCQTLAKKDGYVKDVISHSYYYRCKTIGFHKISTWGRMHGQSFCLNKILPVCSLYLHFLLRTVSPSLNLYSSVMFPGSKNEEKRPRSWWVNRDLTHCDAPRCVCESSPVHLAHPHRVKLRAII